VSPKKPQGKAAVMTAIMAASAVLISKRGVNSITLRDIARKANVNHGLIIRHFGSKEKLIKAVGIYMVKSMFEETKKRNVNLLDSLFGGVDRYSIFIRAIVRIMLDDPDKIMIVDAKPLIDDLLDWIKEEQRKLHINPARDPIVSLFILACTVLGDELFGPYIRKLINIPADSYKLLRPQIFHTIVSALREAPCSHDQTGVKSIMADPRDGTQ
jgi:AcrR family transcriptional regulator